MKVLGHVPIKSPQPIRVEAIGIAELSLNQGQVLVSVDAACAGLQRRALTMAPGSLSRQFDRKQGNKRLTGRRPDDFTRQVASGNGLRSDLGVLFDVHSVCECLRGS